MKKNYLWFDEQLWSSLCAGPRRRALTPGSERRPAQGEQGGPKGCRSKLGIHLILVSMFLATTLLGCNTMRGVGEDVEGGGRGIQRVVDHND